jgi:hypothetical protein
LRLGGRDRFADTVRRLRIGLRIHLGEVGTGFFRGIVDSRRELRDVRVQASQIRADAALQRNQLDLPRSTCGRPLASSPGAAPSPDLIEASSRSVAWIAPSRSRSGTSDSEIPNEGIEVHVLLSSRVNSLANQAGAGPRASID